MAGQGSEGLAGRPLAVFGDIMWFYQLPAEDLPAEHCTTVVTTEAAVLGGSAINITNHLAELGARPLILSAVGSADESRIHRLLTGKNLDVSGLAVYEGPVNALVAFVDKRAARSIFIRHDVPPQVYKELVLKLHKGDVCIYGGSRDRGFRRAIHERLAEADNRLIFAPSYSTFEHSTEELEDFARRADVTILNREEFRYFENSVGGRDAALQLTRCCIVTCDSEGAAVFAEGTRHIVKSRSKSDEDVIGAGDAFLAGFLSTWLRPSSNRDAVVAVEEAARIAAKFVDEHAKGSRS